MKNTSIHKMGEIHELFVLAPFLWFGLPGRLLSGRPRGMSVPKCLFFQNLEALTEVFGRMCAGTSGRRLPLWADFVSERRGKGMRQRSGQGDATKKKTSMNTVAFLAAQKSHQIAVTQAGSQPFRYRNCRVFRFAGRKKIASR